MIDEKKYVKIVSNPAETPRQQVVETTQINNQNITITENGVYEADEGYTGIGTATVLVPNGTQELSVTENGDYTPTGANIGFSSVHVSVTPTLTTKEITANGVYNANDDNADGYSSVDVQVPEPTGTIEITSNGIINVKNYASADVNVTAQAEQFGLPVSSWSRLNVDVNGALKAYTSQQVTGAVSFDGVKTINTQFDPPLAQRTGSLFYGCTGITKGDFPDLETVYGLGGGTLQEMFYGCTGITGTVNLGKLQSVIHAEYGSYASYGYIMEGMYQGCTGITGVDLSSLQTVQGGHDSYKTQVMANMFSGCNHIVGTLNLGSLQEIAGYETCRNMFGSCTGITGVNLSSLTTLGFIDKGGTSAIAARSMFYGCTGITGALDLSALKYVYNDSGQGMFQGCTGIISVNLSGLEELLQATGSGGYGSQLYNMFKGCTGITSINVSNLKKVLRLRGLNATFEGCTSLASVTFDSLEECGDSALQNTFYGCTSLTSLSFPALKSTSFSTYTNFGSSMLSGVTGCTVHFPSNLQSVIGGWSDVQNGFGGNNTTVLFDLPATEG